MAHLALPRVGSGPSNRTGLCHPHIDLTSWKATPFPPATRVLSAEDIQTAIRQFQPVVHGGLTEQIARPTIQEKILSATNTWVVPLASQVRGLAGPETKTARDQTNAHLHKLHPSWVRTRKTFSLPAATRTLQVGRVGAAHFSMRRPNSVSCEKRLRESRIR